MRKHALPLMQNLNFTVLLGGKRGRQSWIKHIVTSSGSTEGIVEHLNHSSTSEFLHILLSTYLTKHSGHTVTGTSSLPQRACHLSPQERNRFRQLWGRRMKETVMIASLASSQLLSRAALTEHWGELSRGSFAAAGGTGIEWLSRAHASPGRQCSPTLHSPSLPWAATGYCHEQRRGNIDSNSVTLSSFSLQQLLPGPCLGWLCRYSLCSSCLIISYLAAGRGER